MWSQITREERFFSATLFHDMLLDFSQFWNVIMKKLPDMQEIKANEVDFSFEVCFFRDGEKAGYFVLDTKDKSILKRTFDFMFFLPDNKAIIIEVKAQQGYKTKQLKEWKESIELIKEKKIFKECYLVGLASSKIRMKNDTKKCFDTIITWNEIVDIYKNDIYKRADELYGK